MIPIFLGSVAGKEFDLKKTRLRTVIFWAVCCDLGLFSKRVISPFANMITDALHIPGGVGTSFSLMFLVIAAALAPGRFCGTIMGAAQSGLALAFGMTGSMGALAPIGYIVPGLVIDLVWKVSAPLAQTDRIILANGAAAPGAAFAANCIVFHLHGVVLTLYLCLSLLSGLLCGCLGAQIVRRLVPASRVQAVKHSV